MGVGTFLLNAGICALMALSGEHSIHINIAGDNDLSDFARYSLYHINGASVLFDSRETRMPDRSWQQIFHW